MYEEQILEYATQYTDTTMFTWVITQFTRLLLGLRRFQILRFQDLNGAFSKGCMRLHATGRPPESQSSTMGQSKRVMVQMVLMITSIYGGVTTHRVTSTS